MTDTSAPAVPGILLTPAICEYIEHLLAKYGIVGVGVSAVGPGPRNDELIMEARGFGIADVKGNKVTEDVGE